MGKVLKAKRMGSLFFLPTELVAHVKYEQALRRAIDPLDPDGKSGCRSKETRYDLKC